MYIIEIFTCNIELSTMNIRHNTTRIEDKYFTSEKQALEYCYKFLVKSKDIEYNKINYKKNGYLFSDYKLEDTNTLLSNSITIKKLEKFKGVL